MAKDRRQKLAPKERWKSPTEETEGMKDELVADDEEDGEEEEEGRPDDDDSSFLPLSPTAADDDDSMPFFGDKTEAGAKRNCKKGIHERMRWKE
jgi:hypothetical protein